MKQIPHPSKLNIYKMNMKTNIIPYVGMGHPNSNNDILSYYSHKEEYNKKYKKNNLIN